jgi:zinc D-Ala-D-Ala dipeptidase
MLINFRNKKISLIVAIFLVLLNHSCMSSTRPKDFVDLKNLCPSILIDARYASENNFTGSVVNGYKSNAVLLQEKAALALCKVAEKLETTQYRLIVFDGFRPQKAVDFFLDWTNRPEDNLVLKNRFYPKLNRTELIPLGYIAAKSSHSRGSTVDLGLYDLSLNQLLDMGGEFDLFDELSHTASTEISAIQKQNRQLLVKLMESFGFKNYYKEWWHFRYTDEEYPNTYFNFDVENFK